MNAICDWCDQRMDPGVACTAATFEINGHTCERIPYGAGGDDWADDGDCHDCNAPQGGLHHPGCDVERCPACGMQAISCLCPAA